MIAKEESGPIIFPLEPSLNSNGGADSLVSLPSSGLVSHGPIKPLIGPQSDGLRRLDA